MTSECACCLRHETNTVQVHAILREHAIVYNPPYDVQTLIAPFVGRQGRRVRVIMHHSSRNVSIVDEDIRHHVLGTVIRTFQNHRLQFPRHTTPSIMRRDDTRATREPNVDSGKTCSICMESILRHDVMCLPCAHIFHRACVGRWLQRSNTCPECRMELT
jgi:hypothetical protein